MTDANPFTNTRNRFRDEVEAYDEIISTTDLVYSGGSGSLNCPPRLPDRAMQLSSHGLPRSISHSLYTTNSNPGDINHDNDYIHQQDSKSLYDRPDQFEKVLHCGRDTLRDIYNALKNDATALDIKDREWLKVIIKDAFLGSALVKWLSKNVYGFGHKREIKRYAGKLLSVGLIRSPMSTGPFSEKCYYTLS